MVYYSPPIPYTRTSSSSSQVQLLVQLCLCHRCLAAGYCRLVCSTSRCYSNRHETYRAFHQQIYRHAKTKTNPFFPRLDDKHKNILISYGCCIFVTSVFVFLFPSFAVCREFNVKLRNKQFKMLHNEK